MEALEGYPLGRIRDVTVNMRSSEDYQMVPHVDPLPAAWPYEAFKAMGSMLYMLLKASFGPF